MVDVAAIRGLMPLCGTCASCKLVVWSGDADVKNPRFTWKLPRDPNAPPTAKTEQVLVRCIWLKQAVEQPRGLIVCEGWRDLASAHSTEKES